jgi:hypothetical protein
MRWLSSLSLSFTQKNLIKNYQNKISMPLIRPLQSKRVSVRSNWGDKILLFNFEIFGVGMKITVCAGWERWVGGTNDESSAQDACPRWCCLCVFVDTTSGGDSIFFPLYPRVNCILSITYKLVRGFHISFPCSELEKSLCVSKFVPFFLHCAYISKWYKNIAAGYFVSSVSGVIRCRHTPESVEKCLFSLFLVCVEFSILKHKSMIFSP